MKIKLILFAVLMIFNSTGTFGQSTSDTVWISKEFIFRLDTALSICQEKLAYKNERYNESINLLDRCQYEKSELIEIKESVQSENNELRSDNQSLERKTKRNRGIAVGVTIIAIIEGVLLWVSK